MGINRKKYISTRPWKKAGMSLERFERITMAVPQEYLDEIRISAEADTQVEAEALADEYAQVVEKISPL